jgi:methylmalonyl-CoA carboxyltransferase small subunit
MQLKVTVNGVAYDVEVEVEEEPHAPLGAIFMTGGNFSPPHARTPVAGAAADVDGVTAPLAGTVARVLVEEGQTIEAGEVVVVLEAMKMETEITAPQAGTVSAVLVSPGTAVTSGQVLLQIT